MAFSLTGVSYKTMYNRETILLAVRAYIAANMPRPIADTENYFESGFVKSLFGIQLIAFIERQFDAAIDDDDLVLTNFNSVENVAAFVCRKKDVRFEPAA